MAEILIILTIVLAFFIMISGRKNVKSNGVYQHPNRDEDLSRIRQMKEWDRFDETRNTRD